MLGSHPLPMCLPTERFLILSLLCLDLTPIAKSSLVDGERREIPIAEVRTRAVTLAPPGDPKSNMKKLELSKMICMLPIFCLAVAIASPAQTFLTFANFDFTHGAGPNTALVQGADGNLYGTTGSGGSKCPPYGCGTVFKLTLSGKLTTLHSFNGADGSYPTGLIQGTDGSFYGTTANGGADNNCTNGCGTVFKITTKGALTMLHSFDGIGGSGPYSGLIQGADGNLYGTTAYGGTNNNCNDGCGTVFKISTDGTFTKLHSFDDTHGSAPNAGLIQATNGIFYGTTISGGTYSSGTVFRITAKGSLTTLHSFDGTDGFGPFSGLIQSADGSFYGTTEGGGLYFDGTIFKITAAGTLTSLYNFGDSDGSSPAGLVLGTDGNIYGTTQLGGDAGSGTVFQLTAKDVLTTLHSFDENDGQDPQTSPVQATNGMFYGSTYFLGPDGYGTAFSLFMGLAAFVKTNPTSGKAGTEVTILGNGLAGVTSVTFNGIKATFTTSSSHITATVPTGATTGTVEVVMAKKTLKSNVPFRILK
jgi:uncharacterized repeat protein (TIGR03803 family)